MEGGCRNVGVDLLFHTVVFKEIEKGIQSCAKLGLGDFKNHFVLSIEKIRAIRVIHAVHIIAVY